MISYDIYKHGTIKLENVSKSIKYSGKPDKVYYEYNQSGCFGTEISLVGRIPYICRKLFSSDFSLTLREVAYFVLYVVNGSVRLQLDSKRLLISKGDMVILDNTNVHKQFTGAFMPVDVIMLWCEGSLPKAYCQLINNKIVHIHNQDNLLALFDKMAYFCREQTPVCEANVLSLLSQFFCLAVEKTFQCSDFEKTKISEGIERAIALIDSEYHTDINIGTLVQISGFSEPHFYRMFHKSMGMTPNQYLISKRITVAKTLLVSTNYQVKHIASLVGYSSVSHFIQHFKKYTFFTPTAYREQQRKSSLPNF